MQNDGIQYYIFIRVVVVCDYDLIQEVGSREDLSGRIVPTFVAMHRGSPDPNDFTKTPGVIASSGRLWQEQRRFSLHALRDLGYGKNGTEELVLEEVEEMCLLLEGTQGEPLDVRNKFNVFVVNALWRISTGERLKHDDPRLVQLVSTIDNFMRELGNPVLPMLSGNKFLIDLLSNLKVLALGKAFKDVRTFIEGAVGPIKSSYQEDSTRNFVDKYIKMVKEQERSNEQKSFLGDQGELNLRNVLVDFFVAGSETTSSTLLWGMLYLMLNPDIQDKVHKELDEVIGKGIQPKIADRNRTPYTEAVLLEIQRLGNITDRALPHRAVQDCYLSSGHFVPKDSMVFVWLGAVMSDPKEFPNPAKFDPTRYLDDNGSFQAHPRVVPFGLGKRRCLGEALAKMQLYLFFTGLMTRFRVEKSHPEDDLTLQPIEGGVMTPQPFKLRFISRQ